MKFIEFLSVIGLFLLTIGCDSTPGRQLVFFNNSNAKLNIVLEKNSTYVIDQYIEPNTNAFAYVPVGTYNIITFDDEGNRVRIIEEYKLGETNERGYLCIDLEGKTTYALIVAAYLYEGTNSLSQILHESVKNNEIIQSYIKSDKPFFLPYTPNWPNEPLPKTINAQSAAWTLVPFPVNKNLNKSNIYIYIDNYLNTIGTE